MRKTWKRIYLQNRRGNEQSQQISFEIFRQKEVIEIVNCSTELNSFLSFLRTCEESNRLAILTENDMDRQTQDILHNIELNENSQYDYICQGFTLRDIRRKRRKAKDIKEATEP